MPFPSGAQEIEFQGGWIALESYITDPTTWKTETIEYPGRNGSIDFFYRPDKKLLVIREKTEELMFFLGKHSWYYKPSEYWNYSFTCFGVTRDDRLARIYFDFDYRLQENKYDDIRFLLRVNWDWDRTDVYYGSMPKYMKEELLKSYQYCADRRQRILEQREVAADAP